MATAPRVDLDRLESLLSLIRAQVEEGRYGAASATIRRLQSQAKVDGEPASRLEQWARRAARGCAQVELDVLACLRRGEVLAADRLAARLERVGGWRPEHALRAFAEISPDWSAMPSKVGLPAPPSFDRRRVVRFEQAGALLEGVVVRSRPGGVTVRVAEAGVQRFPTLEAVALEPIDSTQREAVDCALRAALAGRGRLARLWLSRAMTAGPLNDPRVAALRSVLRAP